MIGIYGTEDFAHQIKEKASNFLKNELRLELSEEKTKVTNLHHDKASFLGFYMRINKPKENKKALIDFKGNKRKVKIGHNIMEILAPISRILSKLEKEGFIRVDEKAEMKYIPMAKTP